MAFKEAFRFDYDFIHQRIQAIVGEFDENSAFACPTPEMNHATWLLGHITWCEDYLIAEVPYGRVFRSREWDILFDNKSTKRNRDNYPSYGQVLSHYENVHRLVSSHFEGLTEESLFELTTYNNAQCSRLSFVLHFIEEGSTHLGQLQYLLKFLQMEELRRNQS